MFPSPTERRILIAREDCHQILSTLLDDLGPCGHDGADGDTLARLNVIRKALKSLLRPEPVEPPADSRGEV